MIAGKIEKGGEVYPKKLVGEKGDYFEEIVICEKSAHNSRRSKPPLKPD